MSQGKCGKRRSTKKIDIAAGLVPIANSQIGVTTQPVVTCRPATCADASALRVLHFDVEAESGQPTHLCDEAFDRGNVWVVESEGKLIGGLLFEEAVVVTLLGKDRRTGEFGKQLLGSILSLAREEGKQFVKVQFPRAVSKTFHLDKETEAQRNVC